MSEWEEKQDNYFIEIKLIKFIKIYKESEKNKTSNMRGFFSISSKKIAHSTGLFSLPKLNTQ
jgi:hypothetical protein